MTTNKFIAILNSIEYAPSIQSNSLSEFNLDSDDEYMKQFIFLCTFIFLNINYFLQ